MGQKLRKTEPEKEEGPCHTQRETSWGERAVVELGRAQIAPGLWGKVGFVLLLNSINQTHFGSFINFWLFHWKIHSQVILVQNYTCLTFLYEVAICFFCSRYNIISSEFNFSISFITWGISCFWIKKWLISIWGLDTFISHIWIFPFHLLIHLTRWSTTLPVFQALI